MVRERTLRWSRGESPLRALGRALRGLGSPKVVWEQLGRVLGESREGGALEGALGESPGDSLEEPWGEPRRLHLGKSLG